MLNRSLLIALVALRFGATVSAAPLRFVVSIPPESLNEPFSGRVVVWLTKSEREPRFGPDWSNPGPCYSAKFKDAKPGEEMIVDDANAVGFPGKLNELEPGEWTVQVVADRNLGGSTIGRSPGNFYSTPQKIKLDPGTSGDVKLIANKVVPEPEFVETDVVKRVRIKSKLLSDFYGRDTFMQAAVVLPEEYASAPERKFPVIYSIPGFGGSIDRMSGRAPRNRGAKDGVPFLMVTLDPSCPTGHCVFADSDNNGPWGKALVTELIPAIESQFRAIGTPDARFVTGHSSGGWSSLWLQVTHPEFFGGCWSTSPDPVSFHDFQQVDLYKPNQNLYVDKNGEPRPLGRRGDKPFLWYKKFCQMERPIRGGQIGSFEAVFGPRGADGEPAHLYDRDTGAVDPKVVEAWKRYDIALILKEQWNELGPKLAGKVHVYMGDMDTFYLDGAVRLLKEQMNAADSDAVIEIVPGDHGSMMTPALRLRIDKEMAEQFRKAHPLAATTRKAA